MNVVKYINKVVVDGINIGVSDIHFKPTRKEVEVFYRIKGKVQYIESIKSEEYRMLLRYVKYKSKLDLGLCQTPQDGSFTLVQKENEEIFIRVSTIPLIFSESLVIRLLTDSSIENLQKIAYVPSDLQMIYNQLINMTGLFVFTGPTGSGKSTSMNVLLEKAVKVDGKKVICIEDPIEVLNDNFTQIQINEKAKLTYANAIKACLRHDPDIIMIGEIRDEETAKSVLRASLTGHTVISTMHTKDKYGVINRFRDFGFKESEIESILIGISNQRLVIDESMCVKALYDFILANEIEQFIVEGELTNIYDKLNFIGEQCRIVKS